jgi:hypothetical protein
MHSMTGMRKYNSVFAMQDEAPKPARQDPDAPGDPIVRAPSAGSDGPGPQIEDLLIAGLDCYFAGRHEEAIHIWTRVLFIDRGHRRARAYIERSRLALAERQREHELLLQDGVAAMGRGDTSAARELLSQSLRDAGPDDRALAALAQLDRLAHAAPAYARTAPSASRTPAGARRPGHPRRLLPVLLILVLSAGAAVIGAGAFGMPDWWTGAAPANRATDAVSAPLPVITTAEAALVRARAMQARGRLREAAQALEMVAPQDALRAEADRLLIEIQDALLASSVR